jgi:hypothetical protein
MSPFFTTEHYCSISLSPTTSTISMKNLHGFLPSLSTLVQNLVIKTTTEGDGQGHRVGVELFLMHTCGCYLFKGMAQPNSLTGCMG